MLRQWLKRTLFATTILTIAGAAAFASRTTYHQARLPGVSRYGHLDLRNGGLARVKLMYDTHRRTFCATAMTYVRNLSGHRQVYHNRLAVGLRHIALASRIPPRAIRITEDRYTVQRGSHFPAATARADAIVCGEVRGNPSPID